MIPSNAVSKKFSTFSHHVYVPIEWYDKPVLDDDRRNPTEVGLKFTVLGFVSRGDTDFVETSTLTGDLFL